jgi:myo-inositol-1(or 4)-monophosphatase
MDDVTVNEWHSYAKSWAKHAGSMMMEARQKASFDREYKTGHELVTSTDMRLMNTCVRTFVKRFLII